METEPRTGEEPEAVILIGLQGAGKTTYYREFLSSTHVLVSLDVARTRAAEAKLLHDCLASRKSFAVDNTNVTAAARRAYIRLAKDAGFRLLACHVNTPVRTAIARNKNRQDKKAIPVPALLKAAKRLEPPSLEEGFDEIRVIPDCAEPRPPRPEGLP